MNLLDSIVLYPKRGVVWEETIHLLPARINLIFLSATVPNEMELAGWIG